MNIFDFLYNIIQINHRSLGPILIAVGVISTAIIIFISIIILTLSKYLSSLSEINFTGKGFSLNMKRKSREKVSLFNRGQPKILNSDKPHIFDKRPHSFDFWGYAFDLGKGIDGKNYFIGYFGQNKNVDGFEFLAVRCETVIGSDWDNTPQWEPAFKKAKEIFKFGRDKKIPNFSGNGGRNSRGLFGLYACDEQIDGIYELPE